MHKLHFLVAGLNIVALSNILQLISWSIARSLSSHTCWLRQVSLLCSGLSRFRWCSFHLSLKHLPVRPVYVSVFPELLCFTQASYITPFCLQAPRTGQLPTPPSQLQGLGSDFSDLNTSISRFRSIFARLGYTGRIVWQYYTKAWYSIGIVKFSKLAILYQNYTNISVIN